jgi:hypothetical protein
VDFLATTKRSADALITNPPYNDGLDDEFALHALALGFHKIALLCRLTWLAGQGRLHKLWQQGKLARIWVFSQRQTLWRGDDAGESDGGMTEYAWFVFDLAHRGGTTIGWLEQDDTGQWHAYVDGRRQKPHP